MMIFWHHLNSQGLIITNQVFTRHLESMNSPSILIKD